MNNKEIKEILQLIGNCCYCGEISEDKCERYCNYITNLQKTQETLIKNDNEIITNLQEEIENKNNEIDVLKDQVEWWKQQCDDLEMQIGEENE